jgi:ATP-dependent Clp protease ATP-binding subunit ClpA
MGQENGSRTATHLPLIMREMERRFAPEFRNRIDEIVLSRR